MRETLHREPIELYPFLGSSLLAQAVDGTGVDLVLHRHAHLGCEEGATPAVAPVRNVGVDGIRQSGAVYRLPPGDVQRVA